MDNVILRKTLALVWKLLVLYSVYMLLRGHNEPGGGFIGGLLLALGIILRGYVTPGKDSLKSSKNMFETYLGILLIGFMFVVIFPSLFGLPILKGMWTGIWVPIAGKFSSVLVFDVVVYIIVALSSVYSYNALIDSQQGGST